MGLQRLLLVGLMLGLCGCMSQIISKREFMKVWVGRPIEEIRQMDSREGSYASSIGWKETTYPLDNGNWVYVTPAGVFGKAFGGGDCFIHYEVNPDGIIVGARTEGKGCRWW